MSKKKNKTLEQKKPRLKRPAKDAVAPGKSAAPGLFDEMNKSETVSGQPNVEVTQENAVADTTAVSDKTEELQSITESASEKMSAEETPIGEEQPMTVGAHLRITRINAGLDIDQVAEALRLRPFQVKAIEDSKYDLLPGKTFVTGFLRSYANFLKLDGVDIVQMFRDEDADGIKSPALYFPEPAQEGRMPGFGLMIAATLGALAIFAGWNYYQMRTTVKLEYVETVPEHLAVHVDKLEESSVAEKIEAPEKSMANETTTEQDAPTSATSMNGNPETLTISTPPETMAITAPLAEKKSEPPISDTEVAAESTAVPQETPVVEPMIKEKQEKSISSATNVATLNIPEEDDDISLSVKQEKTGEQVPVILPVPEEIRKEVITKTTGARKLASVDVILQKPGPEALGLENSNSRIIVRATQESWVKIYSESGAIILTRIFRPGDSFMVPDQPDLKLMTGNAGGLQVRVDGKNVNSLGGKGMILKDFDLVAESLLNNVETSN